MLKLMKYEFRKQWLSKVIILVILGILECIFLYGVFAESERAIGTSMGLFIFLTIAATVFVSFECVFTYSNDLKTKQSYMLFLTPNSTYTIVGAKVLTSMVQILMTLAAFVLVVAANVGFLIIKFDSINQFVDLLSRFMNELMGQEFDFVYLLSVITYLGLTWFRVVILAMLAITLSATFLANSKLKGFVSLIIFLILTYVFGKVDRLFFQDTILSLNEFLIADAIVLITVAVSYLFTSYMLDKKVSV